MNIETTTTIELTFVPKTPEEAVGDAIEEGAWRAVGRIKEFWRRVHPDGTGTSVQAFRVEREGAVVRIVNDEPYSIYVRPAGQAPHQFTTLPIFAGAELRNALETDDLAEHLAAYLVDLKLGKL